MSEMTLFDAGPHPKKCLVYCGDDRCNCESAPRYRMYGIDWGRPGSDKSVMVEAELQADGTVTILGAGEVIEGEALASCDEQPLAEDRNGLSLQGASAAPEGQTPHALPIRKE